MGKGTRTGKTVAKNCIRAGIAVLVTAAILTTAALCALFVIARGPSGTYSDRLCATMVEKDSILAGMFFNDEEQRLGGYYFPPAETGTEMVELSRDGGNINVVTVKGDNWKAVVVSGIDPAKLILTEKNAGATAAAVSVGLEGKIDAVLFDGVVSYAGDGGDELYCVAAMDPDGILHIGGKTVYEIATSGYDWAISASRVLVAGGKPLADLGGGYGTRAAIGQTAMGDMILIFTESTSFYPCGITYDELASLMYEWGAVNAAALESEGGMRLDGTLVCGNRKTPGYSVIALSAITSAEGGVEE